MASGDSSGEHKAPGGVQPIPFAAQGFVVFLCGLTAVVGWLLWPGELPIDQWSDLLFFLVVIAMTEALPIELPRVKGTVSVSFAMCYSAVLVFGPLLGGTLTALGSLRKRELTGQVRILEVLFNRAQLFLAAVSGGVVFQLVTSDPLSTRPLAFAAGTMVGGVTYFAVNVAAMVIYLSLKTGTSARALLASDFRPLAPSYMGLLPIAYLNVAVYETVGKVGVFFFLLPLLVGRYAFSMYSELREVFVSTIRALAAALEARDRHTSGHAERVSTYTVQMAKAMNLPRERIELLHYVSILHDIGKIGIPDEILRKPGRFTPEEWAQMKKHSEIGANILRKIKALREGASWVLHHHERYDGTGYPHNLKGEDIPLEARILAVADSLDAMLSERPYQRALTPEEAREELKRCSGTQFDPKVVEVMLEVMDDINLLHGRRTPEVAAGGEQNIEEGSAR